ncbi:MAG: hypothetical protein ACOC1F_08730 [Myxococcota bacterium]
MIASSEVDDVVERLVRIKRDGGMMQAVDVGHVVVERIYGGAGDQELSSGHVGYRKLASHPRLPFSKSSLWRYVRIYLLARRMPWVVSESALSVSHLIVVLGVEPQQQRQWLERAIEQRWSATQLRSELHEPGELRAADRRAVTKALNRLQRARDALEQLGGLGAFDPYARHQAWELVRETRDFCDSLARSLADSEEQRRVS